MVVDIKFILFTFWLAPPSVLMVMLICRGRSELARRNSAKREMMFVELRSAGYDIDDVNSNATQAKLNYMDPFTETRVWRWVAIIELDKGYGLADPINSERN